MVKNIQFGGGGGLYVYYCGICHCLYQNISHDILKEYNLIGSSAGIWGLLILYISLYTCKSNPLEIYQDYIKNVLINESQKYYTGFLFNGSDCAWKCAEKIYIDFQLQNILDNYKLQTIVSKLPNLTKMLIDKYENQHNFCKYISGTMAVPIIFKKFFFHLKIILYLLMAL